jgi:hypothetical protein
MLALFLVIGLSADNFVAPTVFAGEDRLAFSAYAIFILPSVVIGVYFNQLLQSEHYDREDDVAMDNVEIERPGVNL